MLLTFRPEVEVSLGEGGLRLAFAFWEVDLPAPVLDSAPELRRLGRERRLSRSTLGPAGRSVAALLEAQGCFLPALSATIPLASVPTVLKPIRSALYAQYYRHELWNGLRTATAGQQAFNAWVVHNYHVSRSAGPIAARFACHGGEPAWRESFRQDALEEFWHCDRFYFAGDDALGSVSMKAEFPLPSSMAFEELGLRTAEEDWLGHLLIAWFQESSVMFQEGANRFYDAVERNYQIGPYFAGWRQHMRLDDEHAHAGRLERLFELPKSITHEQLRRALRRMQLAHYFLTTALDEIAGIRPESGELGVEHHRALFASLAEASLRGLSSAAGHRDVMAAGQLHQALDRFAAPGAQALEEPDPWLTAVRNFLLERACHVPRLMRLVHIVLDRLARSSGADQALIGRLALLTDARVETDGDPQASADAARLDALLGRCGRIGLPELPFSAPLEGDRS
jgi:hypothetical protein